MVESLTAGAGEMGSTYWSGKIPHAAELKPTGLEPVLCGKRHHCHKKPTHRNIEEPLSAAAKTQHSQKEM